MASVLVVDADAESASRLGAILQGIGLRSRPVPDLGSATRALGSEAFDAVVFDPGPRADPQTLADALACFEDLPVIVAARSEDLDISQLIRSGATDAVEKPFEPSQVSFVVNKVLAEQAGDDTPSSRDREAIPIGESLAMRQVLDVVRRVSAGSATVLIRGESGTGKELIARALHAEGPRRHAPFVKVHCGALPDTLLESELFGYEKGAFTGAVSRKPGRVEIAEGGTLFLDEIGDITQAIQVKLLRLLQDREYERLGGTSTITANVRFIAATHRDLERMVGAGEFREDLFYRLNVVPVWLPPLRARREDIASLAVHFAAMYGELHGKRKVQLSDSALGTLRKERWPGNVRQLQNFIERLVVLSDDAVLDEAAIRRELAPPQSFSTQNTEGPAAAVVSTGRTTKTPTGVVSLSSALRDAERLAIERALAHAKGNRSLAARLLGVSRASLYTKLDEHGISR